MPAEVAVLSERLLIIGNSGSGKSTLAHRLAEKTGRPAIDLDLIHWDDNWRKRDEARARAMVADVASEPVWIIEGVYGWLAAEALPRATALVWLDLPWPDCRAGLLGRGLRRGMSPADQTGLFAWAAAYRDRETSSSFAGHLRLFEGFAGEKLRLSTRPQVDAVLLGLQRP